jgi:hypothetical protein
MSTNTSTKGYQSAMRSARKAKGHKNDRSKKRLNYTRGFKSVEREHRWNEQLDEYNNTPKSEMDPIQMEPTQMEIKKIPKDEVLQLIESYKEVVDSIITNIIKIIDDDAYDDYDEAYDNYDDDEFAHLSDEEYRQMIDEAYDKAEYWADF